MGWNPLQALMIYPLYLYLPRFHLSHHSFRQSIYSVRIVLLVEAGTEEGGEGLVEAGTDRTQEGLDKMIGRRVAFTIHQHFGKEKVYRDFGVYTI